MDYEYYVMGSFSYKKSFRFLKYYREIQSVPVPCCLLYRSAVHIYGYRAEAARCPDGAGAQLPRPVDPTPPPPASSPAQTTCLSKPFPGMSFFHVSPKYLSELFFRYRKIKFFGSPVKNCKNINYLPLYLWRGVDKWLGHLPVGVWSPEFKFGHGTFMGMGSSR